VTGQDASPARPALPPQLLHDRLVAVLRATDAAEYAPVVDVLVACGIRSIEVTLTTPRALEELPRLKELVGGGASIGVGTVTSKTQAVESLAAGAEFIVTPIHVPGVIELVARAGVAMLPGAFTPTEIHRAWSEGASAVKIFPASLVQPSFARELSGPFPDIAIMPSGGVGLDAITLWLAAGAVAVSMGGSLIGDAFSGDLDALASRARRAKDAVRGWEDRA
jgi:2-dehydro-3-deoxyphosphogluconate aldolase / (4S)-4-hydroxy-2-oxoglutarate aldolase